MDLVSIIVMAAVLIFCILAIYEALWGKHKGSFGSSEAQDAQSQEEGGIGPAADDLDPTNTGRYRVHEVLSHVAKERTTQSEIKRTPPPVVKKTAEEPEVEELPDPF